MSLLPYMYVLISWCLLAQTRVHTLKLRQQCNEECESYLNLIATIFFLVCVMILTCALYCSCKLLYAQL